MIADKVLPSFYVIEVEGKAVESVFRGNFSIEKISIGSRDFLNDMYALAALSDAMQFIALNPELDTSVATEQVDYNPEFFPTLSQTQEQKERKDAADADEEETNEALAATNQVSVPLTCVFDPLGDFVESRWVIESPEFKVHGRVAVNPDRYMHVKVMDAQYMSEVPRLKSQIPRIMIH